MKPIRRKQSCHVTTDPQTGQDRILDWSRQDDTLSDQGSIDSTGVQRKFFLDCGCDAETGGQCFECGAISCKSCHGRCQNCQKPICMQHSHFMAMDNSATIRLCRPCYEQLARKQRRAKVGRFLLSLFVREGREHD